MPETENLSRKRTFCTVLRQLKSPQNVGMIVRSHAAFGGERIVFVGEQHPWDFKKRSQAFSRKLERQCEIIYLADDEDFFAWCKQERFATVALEICSPPVLLNVFAFPARTALIVGNEGAGLSQTFQERCEHVVTIPQFGLVASLNVAVACSVAMYELRRDQYPAATIIGDEYQAQERDITGAM